MTAVEWAVVAVAGVLASGVLGVLLTRTAWAGRRRAPRLVPMLLGVHAAGVLIGGSVLTGGALQAWHRADDEEAASGGLLDLGHIDGDGHMYVLLTVFLVAVSLGAAALLGVAARAAASPDPGSRALACAVLGLEVGLCGFALAQVVAGSRSAGYLVGIAHLPLVIAAMVTTWPSAHRVRLDHRSR